MLWWVWFSSASWGGWQLPPCSCRVCFRFHVDDIHDGWMACIADFPMSSRHEQGRIDTPLTWVINYHDIDMMIQKNFHVLHVHEYSWTCNSYSITSACLYSQVMFKWHWKWKYKSQYQILIGFKNTRHSTHTHLSLIHIWRCRRSTLCRSRWSPYH